VYDPASGTWSMTGTMANPRYLHTATLLPNGKVLVAGGGIGAAALTASEVYDPASNTWSSVPSMVRARYSQAAALLQDGRVLISGGYNNGGFPYAEMYSP
jgi:N-acetylneuraminic acid mutarotase